MKLITPDFYDNFHCIADKCKDSCCIGWELDIDEETYEYYKSVEGAFGDRLRAHMKSADDENECNTFTLNGKRCPFLNDKNLCDIYINLGEESLCEVCTEYPRFTVDYSDILEKSLALSCEEVGRLVFDRTEPLTLVSREIPGTPENDEAMYVKEIVTARDKAMEIISDRNRSLIDRVGRFMKYVRRLQEFMNIEEEKPGTLAEGITDINLSDALGKDMIGSFPDVKVIPSDNNEAVEKYNDRMEILSGLEVLDEEWTNTISDLNMRFSSSETYLSDAKKFYETCKERLDIWFEALYNYFIFRYFTKSVYDCDLLVKAKFAKISCDTIYDMALARFLSKGRFDVADMIDVARIYSKEVEHSEDNLAYLADELLYNN